MIARKISEHLHLVACAMQTLVNFFLYFLCLLSSHLVEYGYRISIGKYKYTDCGTVPRLLQSA